MIRPGFALNYATIRFFCLAVILLCTVVAAIALLVIPSAFFVREHETAMKAIHVMAASVKFILFAMVVILLADIADKTGRNDTSA